MSMETVRFTWLPAGATVSCNAWGVGWGGVGEGGGNARALLSPLPFVPVPSASTTVFFSSHYMCDTAMIFKA